MSKHGEYCLRVTYNDSVVGSKGTYYNFLTVLCKWPLNGISESSLLLAYVKSATDLGGIIINEDGYAAFIPLSDIKKIEVMTTEEKIKRYGKGK